MRLIPQFPSWWGQSQVTGAEDRTVDLAGTAMAHPRVLGRSRDGEEARGVGGGQQRSVSKDGEWCWSRVDSKDRKRRLHKGRLEHLRGWGLGSKQEKWFRGCDG